MPFLLVMEEEYIGRSIMKEPLSGTIPVTNIAMIPGITTIKEKVRDIINTIKSITMATEKV